MMRYIEKHPMIMIVIGVLGISLSSIFVKYSTAPSAVTAAFRLLWTVLFLTPVVIGKPSSLMPELAMEHAGFTKEETAVVGDRIYTDVKSGLNAGVTGILVLSGETTLEILEASEDKPHLVLQDCSEILEAL